MSARAVATVTLLLAATLASALAVLYTQYLSRSLATQVQQQREQRDELNSQWSRLLLERGTLATHGRVERLAHKELGMRTPAVAEIEVVLP